MRRPTPRTGADRTRPAARSGRGRRTPQAGPTRPASRTAGIAALLLPLVVLALGAAPAAAQVSDISYGGGAAYEVYTFSEAAQTGIESINLLTVPFGARAVVADNLDVQLFGHVARGALKRADGGEATLFGPTDTDLQVDYRIGQGGLTLTAVVSAPTGSATHDAEEAAVAGAVAADLLPFRISNWGTGGGLAAQAAAARDFESFGAGVSVAYRASGGFQPQDGAEFTYDPGDELRVRLALDTELGAGGKGSLLIGYQSFSDDAVDGTNVFQSGDRYDATASYAFPAGGAGAGVVYAGVIHRSNGTVVLQGFGGGAGPPSQDLVLLGSQFRLDWGGVRVTPRLDGRLFRSEDGRGQGYVGGAGLSLEFAGGGITWTPSVTGRFGNLEVAQGRESSFTGFVVGLSARFNR